MIIEPKIRGFICTTAHPGGCKENVRRQIAYVKQQPRINGFQRVLVIGASTGYGLASRISAAFGGGASTLGVIFDKPAAGSRTASAGWYNTAAFEDFAKEDGLYAKSVNGDAFSEEIKQQVIQQIKTDLGTVDLVVYSLASSRRTMEDGTVCNSVLKTTGDEYTNKTIDLKTNEVTQVTISPANEQEVADTVKVMGGEDWENWMHALFEAGVLAEKAVTVAYSYIGPEITHPIYLNGSIGMAKKDLYDKSVQITKELPGVKAYISVNKALVTQSSAAIPIVPLYISILYKVMKRKNCHEGCIEQMYRMLAEKLQKPVTDDLNRIRLDDYEMQEDIQKEVETIWQKVNSENVEQYLDLDGYWEDFYQMFGFHVPEVSYGTEAEAAVEIPSIG